jgi:hypothetical protein
MHAATERKVVTIMQEADMRSDDGRSNMNELRHMPIHGDVGDDTPLRLAVAAATAFPDGSMTASGLRRECARGRLVIERIAGRDSYTDDLVGTKLMEAHLARRHRPAHQQGNSLCGTKAEWSYSVGHRTRENPTGHREVNMEPEEAVRVKANGYCAVALRCRLTILRPSRASASVTTSDCWRKKSGMGGLT